MADEEYVNVNTDGDGQTNTESPGDGGSGGNNNDDYKSQMSETDLIKLDLLRGLIQKNVNLSDFELAELTGFSTNQIRDIRATAIKSTLDSSDVPLSWDYVLAFECGDREQKRKPSKKDLKNKPDDDNDPEWDEGMSQDKYYGQIFNNFWQRLESAKLSVEAYRSKDKKMMFLIVGITEANLKVWADERDTDLLIDPKGGVEVGRTRNFALAKRTRLYDGDPEAQGQGGDNGAGDDDNFNETLDLTNWNYMYGEYSQQANQKVYKHYKRLPNNDNLETVFDERTRLRIIYESIIADTNEGGAEIKIEDCLLNKHHPLMAVFPLHNQERLDYFNREWIKNCNPAKWMWCPLGEIRDYFGEPVAFYFAFLQFYLKWLIAPAIIGLIFFIWQLAVGEVAVTGIPFLCFFMIFWSVAFVDFWARAESRYRLMWGMTKFQQKAVARPQFDGEWTHDVVSGLWVEEFSIFKRACRVSAIYTFVSIWLSACVVSVIAILLQRDANPNNLLLKIGLGVANAVMIFVFDAIYKLVSQYGNEWENHRTEQDFQNALIYKSFCFKFINSFASLFYLGFVRPVQNGLYYYVRFYATVCKYSGPSMGQYLSRYDTSRTDDITEWFNDLIGEDCMSQRGVIDQATLEAAGCTNSEYIACINTAASDETDKSCIDYVVDSENRNEAWQVTVEGYYVDTSVVTDCGADSMSAAPDSDGFCEGVCDEDQTLIDWNEAVLGELQIQLLTLFLTAIVIQNTLEVGVPFLVGYCKDNAKKKQAEKDGVEVEESEAEDQAERDRYANTIDDMSELIIQFGYVTLFVMAFPITPLLAIVNNIIEMKVDATNLVATSQRPDPNGSYGLGSWNGVLQFFSIVAVGTNVALITWRTKLVTLVLAGEVGAQWIFFSILSITLGLLVGVEKWIIPDVPLAVEQAIERQRLVEAILILGAGVDIEADEPPGDDDDGAIQFDPSLEFIDVETLPDIPTQDLQYGNNQKA